MIGELIINGKDAYTTWGVRMGEGFVDSICAPVPLKPLIENKSRLEDGKRVLSHLIRQDERELTLSFTICGSTKEEYSRRQNSFYEELYKGVVNVKVPQLGSDTFRLVYIGKSSTYGRSVSGNFGRVSVKFQEPNPKNRA